jgi:hypothetical protein
MQSRHLARAKSIFPILNINAILFEGGGISSPDEIQAAIGYKSSLNINFLSAIYGQEVGCPSRFDHFVLI